MPAMSAAVHLALPSSPQNISTGQYLEVYLLETYLKTVLGVYRVLLALSLMYFLKVMYFGGGQVLCRKFRVTCFNLL